MTAYNIVRFSVPFALLAFSSCAQREFDHRVKLGRDALKSQAYKEAAEQFKLAIKARPDAEAGHLGLGAAYLNQYLPFEKDPDPGELAKGAEAEFRRAIEINPKSARAMECLASLAYQQAYVKAGASFKAYVDLDPAKMDEARSWFEKAGATDPADEVAQYGLGALDWERAEGIRLTRFAQMNIDPWNHATPLADAALRTELKAKTAALYESSMKEMKAVSDKDPQNIDAITFQITTLTHQIELADSAADAARLEKERDALFDKRPKAEGLRYAPDAYSELVGKLPVSFAKLPPPPPPPAAAK